MKLVRNLAAALFLACALTVTVYAGDQQTPAFVPPPPATSATDTTDKTTAPSAVDGKEVVATEETTETPEDILVSALLALLSVF